MQNKIIRRVAACVNNNFREYHKTGKNGHIFDNFSYNLVLFRTLLHLITILPVLTERCRSGRTGRFRKPVNVQTFRGFESLPLRHKVPITRQLRSPWKPRGLLAFCVKSGIKWNKMPYSGHKADTRHGTETAKINH